MQTSFRATERKAGPVLAGATEDRRLLTWIIHERAGFFSSPGVYAWVRETTRFLPARFSGLLETGLSHRLWQGLKPKCKAPEAACKQIPPLTPA